MFTLNDYWKILNYLGGTSVINLDINTQILSSSEKSVSLSLFENTIDQIPHTTDDYKRLKDFLVDWYAAHRTIITTQKQSHDVFSLPDRDLTELLKSFGFIFSTTSLSFLTKANFFLDLVNLYKVKGTPQTLIDVLQYFGLSDIDLAEYWLEKDNSGNLVFRSERYLPPGVLDITFANIEFDEMVRDDPHWRLSSSQVENLLTTNNIGLPSKSPYFSIRPRYNLSTLNALISVLSRHVQDTYLAYSGGETLIKDIKLTQLNIYASFFDLYLACVYTFNENFGRTTGSSDPLFFCYDGTTTPRIDVVINQYRSAVSRVGAASSIENESRSAREAKILNFYDLFTRDMSTNFLTSYNTAGNILQTTNDSLYNTINVYLSSGNGEEILDYLMNDLNAWVILNIGAGYPDIAATMLGLGSLLELNKIINFFKPYHARMIKLEFALIVDDPLLDSIVVEDRIIDNPKEIVVDFDVADSTACIICEDSTCVSHHSRELYDCGSQFDIGASTDNVIISAGDEIIEDILNFHDATSSNAYEQIVFADIDDFESTRTFCDGSASLTILLAGGWANMDENGVFDGQHGNDLVQIYIEDFTITNVWATTTALTEAKYRLAGCGTTADALSFGGYTDDEVNTAEIWDGSLWATTTSLTEVKDRLAGCGTTTDTLCFGGYTGAAINTTEIWDGSTWATTTALTEAKYRLTGCGDTSDALCFGGYTDDEVNTAEIWDGSLWATTTSLTEVKDRLVGCGTTSAALCFGGRTDAAMNTTEKWDGSLWATTTSLNESRYSHAGCGIINDALCYGGYSDGQLDTTEIWNGSVWSTTGALIEAKNSNAGCGNVDDALCIGGYTGDGVNTTEIWGEYIPSPPSPPVGVWSTTSSTLSETKTGVGACGTYLNALCIGGFTAGGGLVVDTTEKWDGSIWATTSVISQVKTNMGACGTISDALCIGGHNPYQGLYKTTEIWGGSSWATTTVLNAVIGYNVGCGNTGDALSFGGDSSGFGGYTNKSEIWDGSTWATTSVLNESKTYSGCGNAGDALAFGGGSPTIDTTEIWNGSVWATTTSLTEVKWQVGGCGDTGDSLCFGGDTGDLSSQLDTTEIWDGSTWATNGSLNVAKLGVGGCGNIDNALCFGGDSGARIDTTEIWTCS